MSDDTGTAAASDGHLRGCLVRLLGVTAARPDLKRFTGQIWLTYPSGRRLTMVPLSGDLDPGVIRGKTFPEVLAMLAVVLTTEHGHVLCHSMVRPGLCGVIAVGYTMYQEGGAEHLVPTRPMLLAVMVQLDGRELAMAHDPVTGVATDADERIPLDAVVANTWAIADALYNMSTTPLRSDAARLAQEIVDVEPRLVLESGRQVKMSGSAIPGSLAHGQAAAFVARAARLAPPARGGECIQVAPEAADVVAAYTAPAVDRSKVAPRTFRRVD